MAKHTSCIIGQRQSRCENIRRRKTYSSKFIISLNSPSTILIDFIKFILFIWFGVVSVSVRANRWVLYKQWTRFQFTYEMTTIRAIWICIHNTDGCTQNPEETLYSTWSSEMERMNMININTRIELYSELTNHKLYSFYVAKDARWMLMLVVVVVVFVVRWRSGNLIIMQLIWEFCLPIWTNQGVRCSH